MSASLHSAKKELWWCKPYCVYLGTVWGGLLPWRSRSFLRSGLYRTIRCIGCRNVYNDISTYKLQCLIRERSNVPHVCSSGGAEWDPVIAYYHRLCCFFPMTHLQSLFFAFPNVSIILTLTMVALHDCIRMHSWSTSGENNNYQRVWIKSKLS